MTGLMGAVAAAAAAAAATAAAAGDNLTSYDERCLGPDGDLRHSADVADSPIRLLPILTSLDERSSDWSCAFSTSYVKIQAHLRTTAAEVDVIGQAQHPMTANYQRLQILRQLKVTRQVWPLKSHDTRHELQSLFYMTSQDKKKRVGAVWCCKVLLLKT